MNKENLIAIVDKKYVLEKFPGKGGWTFARIPEIKPDHSKPFGWVKVHGFIDGVAIAHFRLMPMGDGTLFFPVKAELRKKIGKKEGDQVHLILFADNNVVEVPEEMLICLRDDPHALLFFQNLSGDEQHAYIKWIYEARTEETRIARLAKAIDRLSLGLQFHEKALMQG